MKVGRRITAVGLAGIMALAACDTATIGSSGTGADRGFEKSYFRARTALEERNYATAIRHYNGLLTNAGPLESRMRLELSHAYLRSDQYAEASAQARQVAAAHQDERRAAALAVYATAEHRMAQDAMSDGDFGPTTRGHLQAADKAFAEMLKTAPDLDPLNSMAERHRMVKASLKQVSG